MSNFADFFLRSNSNVVQLELLEVSHPSFSKVYRIVRNAVEGVTVTLETSEVATFDYYPVQIELGAARADLDQSININIGDLGEVLPKELDAVKADNSYNIKPTLIYRTYRSDILTEPMYGPIHLEIENFAFNKEGASFEAKAPSLNVTKTGELYKFDRFIMLRGFL